MFEYYRFFQSRMSAKISIKCTHTQLIGNEIEKINPKRLRRARGWKMILDEKKVVCRLVSDLEFIHQTLCVRFDGLIMIVSI